MGLNWISNNYLVVTVNPGLNLAIEDQRHELVLEAGHGRVEVVRHGPQVGRQVGAEVLDQPPVPDHRVQVGHVVGEVHVQQEIVADLPEQGQALAVLALVEAENNLEKSQFQSKMPPEDTKFTNLSKLRIQLKEQFEAG